MNDVVSATFWGVTAVNDIVVTPSLCICPTAVPTVLMVKLLLLNVPADVVSSIPSPSISFNADTFVVPAWSFNIISCDVAFVVVVQNCSPPAAADEIVILLPDLVAVIPDPAVIVAVDPFVIEALPAVPDAARFHDVMPDAAIVS